MADGTNIEWTDATWNPITGCRVKSPGCKFCYAMKLAGTRLKHHPSREGLTVDTKNGPVWNGEARFNEAWLTQPLKWAKPRMIFVCAHADLFYEAVLDEWIDRVFAVMASSPRHIFQVLTKRPERMRDYLTRVEEEPFRETVKRFAKAMPAAPWADFDAMTFPSPNIWLGTSVEDQERADERREPMRELAEAGWLTWVSYEPALGQVDWHGWEFLRWMVSGGESGEHARPSSPSCHRQARDFCAASAIPYLFKQWGAFRPATEAELVGGNRHAKLVDERKECGYYCDDDVGHVDHGGEWMVRVGKKKAGRALDGVIHDGFPQVAA
ncbi:MAG: phage Gp37/Gp68 family protein [Mesorhizobium sp.]|uniref:phage Gp37/Gp68 family protein n=1 Tax=Mesorhizobium sp. TaxID=1871066 RepID=UPI000FE5375A|nr:phage Gp37/Gp68 family protein [Mesorhizobium sp.]RWE55170.1 MAG: phage Gp37/Gp68 family protein [Mesorhizobium sp.]